MFGFSRFFTLMIFFFIFPAAQAQENENPVEKLNWMIGDWAITLKEESTGGEFFIDKGFRSCSYVAERRMIRCETLLERFEAEGRYQKPPLTRTSFYYYSFNPEKGQYMLIYFPAGKEPGVNYMDYDTEKRELSFTRPWVHTTLGIESVLSLILRPISDDEFQGIEKVDANDGSYKEQSTLTAKRIN